MSIYDEIAKLKQKRQPARPKSEAQFQAERAEEKKLAHLMAMEIKDKAVIWAVSADDYKTGKLSIYRTKHNNLRKSFFVKGFYYS